MSSLLEEFDVRDLMLEVQAEFGEIVQELLDDLAAPAMKQAVAMQYAKMPAEQKESIYRNNPDVHNALQQYIKQ